MISVNRYLPPTETHWQGRADTPANACFFQIMKMLDLRKPFHPQNEVSAFAIIGFCCDEGIRRNRGRIGAKEGPNAIRQSLAKLPMRRANIICYDAGNITCEDGDLEDAQKTLSEAVALLLQQGMTPIVLGGGHEVAWGHYQGIAKAYPNEDLGIINFDAHFDMRPILLENKGSSGTPFLQIAKAHDDTNRRFDYNCIGIQTAGNIEHLFDTAKHYHAHVITADEMYFNDTKKISAFIDRIISENQLIYLSLCLDVFAAPFAPGVSAPQTLGLTPWQVIPLVRQLAMSKKIVSYDIAELSPPFDISNRTASLAANFIYQIIHHHASKD